MRDCIEIVKQTRERLEEAKIESGRVNAEDMIASILECRPADLYMNNITLDDAQMQRLDSMVKQRILGEPLQYITGKVDFYGNELFVEPGVFIPRPETEILVDTVIKIITTYDIRHTTYEPSILDLCTGSGNIAISLTKAIPDCKIIASDISGEALRLARRNASENGVLERIDLIRSDIFKALKPYKGSFDIIVSNPPYVNSFILEELPADIRREPKIALDGGKDGMDFYKRIIKEAPAFLKDGGFLALELADDACEKVKDLFEASKSFCNIQIFNDLNNIERVVTAKRI